MASMWSRPSGLSLRTAWVTPATIALSLVVSAVAALLGGAAIWRGVAGAQLLPVIGGVVACLLALGAGCLAVFGVRQRLIRRSSS